VEVGERCIGHRSGNSYPYSSRLGQPYTKLTEAQKKRILKGAIKLFVVYHLHSYIIVSQGRNLWGKTVEPQIC